MVNEFADITTDLLLELIVAVLEAGRPLTSKEGAHFEKIQRELQRRMEAQGLTC